MSMHNVRFTYKEGAGSTYGLLCEIDRATTHPATSDLTFQSRWSLGKCLATSGISVNVAPLDKVFGTWFYMSSRQLQRLGFHALPFPESAV